MYSGTRTSQGLLSEAKSEADPFVLALSLLDAFEFYKQGLYNLARKSHDMDN